jgi:hypothetical protein
MFDMDWEVKHGALVFWQTLLAVYLPFRNQTEAVDTKIQNFQQDLPKSRKNDVCVVCRGADGMATSMADLMKILKEAALIEKLAAVVEDEDPTVARQACCLLLNLHNCLQTEIAKSELENSTSAEFVKEKRVKLQEMNLKELLEKKNRAMSVDGENPLSLIQDILAGTEENDSKFLDCY